MEKYDHKKIEQKWQKRWEKEGVFAARDNDARPKFYALVEFPYPSGEGLHVGHPRSYTAMDIIARKRRMQGYNVLYPIGFDSFGLPTENYAIKTGRPPAEITKENIANFTKQLKMMGFSFDWDRAVTTSDPAYYKWTQWIFLQFFKHGLAYKKKMAINWCPSCKIGLANEEVVDGSCERCGTTVEKREKEQWMLAITKYADKLLEGLKEVDYIERARVQQENWIGRKEGINIEYQVVGSDKKIVCFTTRPDTNFGATFVVLGPEHPLALELSGVEHKKEVQEYIASTKKVAEAERLAEGREKTGAFTGAYCVNNLNGEKMPIWISDYVLGHVGTGAVVGVPGHDLRDFEFAKKFGIAIKRVVVGSDGDISPVTKKEQVQEEKGTMINSEFLDGMDIHAATKKVMDYLVEKGWGKRVVNYKLRDWVFSRQRYWGEPIPLVYCEACAAKRQKVLFIHGWKSAGEKNEPLKRELGARGFEVFTPVMSTVGEPDFEAWMKELQPYVDQLGEDDIIIGTSLGGHAAASLVERNNKKIGALILMAPAIGTFDKAYWEKRKQDMPERAKGIDQLRTFIAHPIDMAKVSSRVTHKEVVWSDDDTKVPEPTRALYPSGWHINRVSGQGHFTGVAGVPIFVETVAKYKNSGWVPLPEEQLPLELPKVEKYQPTDTGESPLAGIEKWVKTKCPKCGGPARRETDTMPNWAGSSWYFLRYCDPENKKEFASMEKLEYWMAPTSPNLPSGRGGSVVDQPKYFIFDFDGVIGDTFEAVLAAKVKMGYDPDLEAARKSTMKYAMEKPDHAPDNGLLTKEELERMNEWTKRFGEAMAKERFNLFDEFIREVERVPNARLAIISSGSEIYVRPAMERSKLKTTHILNFEDHHSKVEKIERVCKDWGVGIKDIYYFTDTKADVFEIEDFVDRTKIVGCAWGYLGKDELESVLPRKQILENYADIHRLYGQATYGGGVDWYNGGMEHTVLHLLYSRFWNQFLYDIGVAPTREPYKKRTSHGMILAEDGEKMSKSRGNVINPNEIVEKYGADVLRVYEMFMGPFDQQVPWSTKSIAGVERFLERVWGWVADNMGDPRSNESDLVEVKRGLHKLIKKVTEDIEAMKFNTAIAGLMGFYKDTKAYSNETKKVFIILLYPFAPHICEELWEKIGGKGLLAQQSWPKWDPALIVDEEIELVIQINGKVRDRLRVAADINEQDAKAVAMESEKVQKWLGGQKIKDVVFIKGKLLNIVIGK